jgi:N6-L-threonylcarbamoyladenine synthase
MRILAIETSCDDTCLAILEVTELKTSTSFKILSSAIQSQTDIHTKYGGVFPMMAKREHMKNIGPLYAVVLKEAKITEKKIDAIAVTVGPGLEPALWVGIVFAEELAKKLHIPIIPTNHMEGHVFSIFPNSTKTFKIGTDKKIFPMLSLLVSGGHTELIVIRDWFKYKKIGQTRDDAAGEAFDKVARMLGLPYPGGPEIGRLAEAERNSGRINNIALPRPMIYSKDYDFSFSGLKTAVLYLIRDLEKNGSKITPTIKSHIAREFEDAAIEVLVKKTLRATKEYKIKTLIVGGGVSASTYLRQELNKEVEKLMPKVTVHFPAKGLSTDNAIMIGIAGYFQYIHKKGFNPTSKKYKKLKADGNLSL